MQSTALATDPAQTPPKRVKEPRIPPKISQIVDWLVMGACKNQQAACERAHLDPSYVSRELRKVHVQAFMARRARETIANGTLRASARLIELIDAESEHVAAKVAERILTSEGILRSDSSQVSVNVGVSVGYIVKLRHADVPTQASHALPITIDADKV